MKIAIYIFIIAIIIMIVIIAIAFLTKDKNIDSSLQYRKKHLLTKNEYSFFQKIKPIAQKHNMNILCKIRLADLIEPVPNENKKEWYTAFNKIKSKHIDFAIANENMKIICLIELQDKTHQKTERIERDEFISKAIKQAEYKMICIYNNAEGIKQIEEFLMHQ